MATLPDSSATARYGLQSRRCKRVRRAVRHPCGTPQPLLRSRGSVTSVAQFAIRMAPATAPLQSRLCNVRRGSERALRLSTDVTALNERHGSVTNIAGL